MKTYLYIALLFIYMIIYIATSHIITTQKMNNLSSLSGLHMSRDDLKGKFKKSCSELKDPKEISSFSHFMGTKQIPNSTIYKISGKGMPYYYGMIFFDTLDNKVAFVSIKKLD